MLLPDGGGEAILRKVRDGGLPTRVAVTTGADDPHYLSEVKAMTPEDFYAKPINVADVWRHAGILARKVAEKKAE